MARYIDADALFEPNESTDNVLILGRSGGKTIALAERLMRERVNMAPTITLDDLRPKGRWVDGECTNCGCDALYNKGIPVPTYTEFCPTCGADMRGYMSDGQRNQDG